MARVRTLGSLASGIEIRGLVSSTKHQKKAPARYGAGHGRLGGRHRPVYTDAQPAVLRTGGGLFDQHGDRVGVGLNERLVLTRFGAMAADDRLRAIDVWVDPFGFVHARARSSDLEPQTQ